MDSDDVGTGGASAEERPASNGVSPGGRSGCELDVLKQYRIPQLQLVHSRSAQIHAHRLVTRVECVVQLQYRPRMTSTV